MRPYFVCLGFLLVASFVPPARFQISTELGAQKNAPKENSNAQFLDENYGKHLGDLYDFINDFTKESITDKKRILPTRQIHGTAKFQPSTPSLRGLQNLKAHKSVANKNEPIRASSRTMKEKQTHHSINETPQGLDAKTSGAVSLITGTKDKDYKPSLAELIPHNRYSELLARRSSSVLISSVNLPTTGLYSGESSKVLNLNSLKTPQLEPKNEHYLTTSQAASNAIITKPPVRSLDVTNGEFSNEKLFVSTTRDSLVDETVFHSLKHTDKSLSIPHPRNSELKIVPRNVLTTNGNLLSSGEILSHDRLEVVKKSGKQSSLRKELSTVVGIVSGMMASVNHASSFHLFDTKLNPQDKASMHFESVMPVLPTTITSVVQELYPDDGWRWSGNSIGTAAFHSERVQIRSSSPSSSSTGISSSSSSSSSAVVESLTTDKVLSETQIVGQSVTNYPVNSSSLIRTLVVHPTPDTIHLYQTSSSSSSSAAMETPSLLSSLVNKEILSTTSSSLPSLSPSISTPTSTLTSTSSSSPTSSSSSSSPTSSPTSSSTTSSSTSSSSPTSSPTSSSTSSSSSSPASSSTSSSSESTSSPSSPISSSSSSSSSFSLIETPLLASQQDQEFSPATTSPFPTTRTETPELFSALDTTLLSSASITTISKPSLTFSLSKPVVYLPDSRKQDSLASICGRFTTQNEKNTPHGVSPSVSSSFPSLSVTASPLSLRSNISALETILSSTRSTLLPGQASRSSIHLQLSSLASLLSSSSSSEVKTEFSRGFFSPSKSMLSAVDIAGMSMMATESLSQHALASTVESRSSVHLHSEVKMSRLSLPPLISSSTSWPTTSSSSPSSSQSLSALSSPSLLSDYPSSSLLATISTKTQSLISAMPTASPSPSMLTFRSLIQHSRSSTPRDHVSDTSFSVKSQRSSEKTKHNSSKLQFIFTSGLSGKPTKSSVAQKTPDLPSKSQRNSVFLSTSSNGPAISYGIDVQGTNGKPPSKTLISETETSTTKSTNTPFNKLSQSLFIVSSIGEIPFKHHTKSHERILISVPTSAVNQSIKFTVEHSRISAKIRLTSTKPVQTAVFKTKGVSAMLRIYPSSTMEGSRFPEAGTHGLNTKKLSSFKETMRMRGSLTARETGVSEVRKILETKSSPVKSYIESSPTEILPLGRQNLSIKESTSSVISKFTTFSVLNSKSTSRSTDARISTQQMRPIPSSKKDSLTRTSEVLEISTTTSGELPDVTESVSSPKETSATTRDHPQDSAAVKPDVVVAKTLSVQDPKKGRSTLMAYYSISPSPSIYSLPTSSSIPDGNLSITTTSDDTASNIKNGTSNDKIILFIIVATIPTAILLILIAIVLFRRVKEREAEPFYKIQVEYTDDNKPRRPRSVNSRLDLTIKGMHIDLEFPSPGEKRKSARLSAPPNLSDAQMRELQKLSQECKENLEWINEVLERELDMPAFSGSSSSDNDTMDAACTNYRDSFYSGCSEKEKENYEVSEKIIMRESPKHSNNSDNDEIERESYLENDDDDNDDSGISKNDSDELKIKLDQNSSPSVPPKPKKPAIPPKPTIKLIASDGVATLVNPLSSSILIECAASRNDETKSKQKINLLQSKNPIPRKRPSLPKPPVPERKGKLARKPGNDTPQTKPEFSLRTEDAEKKELLTVRNRMNKPPIPEKPKGLVINSFRRPTNNEEANEIATSGLGRSGQKLEVCYVPRKGSVEHGTDFV